MTLPCIPRFCSEPSGPAWCRYWSILWRRPISCSSICRILRHVSPYPTRRLPIASTLRPAWTRRWKPLLSPMGLHRQTPRWERSRRQHGWRVQTSISCLPIRIAMTWRSGCTPRGQRVAPRASSTFSTTWPTRILPTPATCWGWERKTSASPCRRSSLPMVSATRSRFPSPSELRASYCRGSQSQPRFSSA